MKRKSLIGLVSALFVCSTLAIIPGAQAETANGGFHVKAEYDGFSDIYPALKLGEGSPTNPIPDNPEAPGNGSETPEGDGGGSTTPGGGTPGNPDPTDPSKPETTREPLTFTTAKIGSGNCGITLRGSYAEDVRVVSPSGVVTVVRPEYTAGQQISVSRDPGQWRVEGPLIGVSMAKMDCLISLDDWGTLQQSNMSNFFDLAVNLKSVATPPRGIVNASYMFKNALLFRGDLSDWDTSTVTNMTSILEGARAFDGDISSWDTSNVVRMGYALGKTAKLDSDLSNWNVCKVQNYNQWNAGSGIQSKAAFHPRFGDTSVCS